MGMIAGITPGMIQLHQEAMSMNAKIAISLPEKLLPFLDQLAQKWATTRSGALAELIRKAEQEEINAQLKEGYIEMAELHKKDAEFFLPAQVEAIRDGN